jgi:predicted Na+-dependent transporter
MHLLSKVLVAVLIATTMFEIGLSLPHGALRRKLYEVGQLIRGLVLFLVIAPLTAALVAWVFRVDITTEVALVLLSSAGVVPLAPKFARAARGDVALALVLNFALGLVTIVTCVPTAKWLVGYSGEVRFEPGKLIAQLVLLQGVALALGVLVHRVLVHRVSGRVDSLAKVVRFINTGVFVVIAVLIVAPHLHAIAAPGWRGVVAAVTLAVVLAIAGYLVGGPRERGARTLAAIANGPNIALALVIVARVGAAPAFSVTIVGVFLLRMLVGILVQRMLARRAEHGHAVPPEASRT